MKNVKKILTLSLALLMTFGTSVSAVACNKPQENPSQQQEQTPKTLTYTFNALDQNGDPIPNAKIQLEKAGAQTVEITTNENGSATAELTAGYKATFSSLPDFYTSNAEYTTIEAITSYTLVANKPVYLTEAGKPLDCLCAGEDATLVPPHYLGFRTSHHIKLESGKTYVVTNEANTELVYSFAADASGKYAIYSIGNVDTVLEHYQASEFYFPDELTPDVTADDRSQTDKNFYYEMDIPTINVGTPNTFVFRAKDTSVAATFGIVIERIGESSIKDDVYEEVRNENLAKAPERTTGQTRSQLNTDYKIFYNETDGYYHIDSKTSPYIAMVAITSENAYETLTVSLSTACQNESFSKRIPQEDGAYNLIISYNSYVILDIAGMVYNPILNGRGGYEVQDETAPKVNSDGDYPLTKELYEMIENYICKVENVQEASKFSIYKFLYYYA